MHSSLNISDVVELVLICMVLFGTIGFFCGKNFYRIKTIYRFARRLRSGLKDEGSFSKFMQK